MIVEISLVNLAGLYPSKWRTMGKSLEIFNQGSGSFSTESWRDRVPTQMWNYGNQNYQWHEEWEWKEAGCLGGNLEGEMSRAWWLTKWVTDKEDFRCGSHNCVVLPQALQIWLRDSLQVAESFLLSSRLRMCGLVLVVVTDINRIRSLVLMVYQEDWFGKRWTVLPFHLCHLEEWRQESGA
jgi:hypothetical protein